LLPRQSSEDFSFEHFPKNRLLNQTLLTNKTPNHTNGREMKKIQDYVLDGAKWLRKQSKTNPMMISPLFMSVRKKKKERKKKK
jgi:hypothetical protein